MMKEEGGNEAAANVSKQHVLFALKNAPVLPGCSFTFFIPDSLKGDRDAILEAFKRKRSHALASDAHFQELLTELKYDWRNDRELVLLLCESEQRALSDVLDSLKEDEEVVRTACKRPRWQKF